MRKLALASRAFHEDPPEGFERPILKERGLLFIATEDQRDHWQQSLDEYQSMVPSVRPVEPDEAIAMCPVLDREAVVAGIFEPGAMDLDVHTLHTGFLRGIRHRGGEVRTRAPVTAIEQAGSGWKLTAGDEELQADVVVNAAGAWCDEVAALAGAAPVGLVPKRRTAFTFDPPDGMDPGTWPATIDIDEEFYFRPDAGRILGSPADETPSRPCDAQPEEMDLALGAHRIEEATVLQVRRMVTKWAGLRSFVADKTPVVGFDGAAEGFFWLAGQGGYGIQTSPALGRTAAALITSGELPGDLKKRGLEKAMLAPERLR